MVAWLVRLFNCCFESGRVPRNWCRADIVALFKRKRTRYDCESIPCSVEELFGKVKCNRNRNLTYRELKQEQYGFRSWKGCVVQLFVAMQFCDFCLAKVNNLFWDYMDQE